MAPQAKATPTGTPRPQQWLLMGVQGCRLPALKPLKPLKPLKRLKPLKSFLGVQALKPLKPLKPLKRLKPLKSFLGVQACRLAALKTFKCLKHVKASWQRNPAGKSYPNRHPKATAMAQPRRQKLPQQAPQGHSNGFLWAFKAAVCQPLNP